MSKLINILHISGGIELCVGAIMLARPSFIPEEWHIYVAVLMFFIGICSIVLGIFYGQKKERYKKLPTMTIGQVLKHIKHSRKKSLRLDWQQYEDAWEKLTNQLSYGSLSAWGKPQNNYNGIVEIKAKQWSNITCPLDATIERGTNFITDNEKQGLQYRDVRFHEAEVFNIWPKRKNLLN